MSRRPRLLFVSPRFLFPTDSGGKIRTTQILRGLKGGTFDITLVSPAPRNASQRFEAEVSEVCDAFLSWPVKPAARKRTLLRTLHLLSDLPISVRDERSEIGRRLVEAELIRGYDLVVFDFPHSSILAPHDLHVPTLLFTHNVECEIYQRHAQVSASNVMRRIWLNQYAKMRAFERNVVSRFDWIVAVSERDASFFKNGFGAENVSVISTGVDLGYFQYAPPAPAPVVVFSGSMDWTPNLDGMTFLMDEVWPLVVRKVPGIQMKVIGRAPSDQLIKRSLRKRFAWTFTGFVEDVRPHIRDGAVYAVPLRIGGGTRIKVYEAMAMGIPIVSTAIGVEGLPVVPGEHFLLSNSAPQFAAALVALIETKQLALTLSRNARKLVEERFSYTKAARMFEQACLDAMSAHNASGRLEREKSLLRV